MPSSRSNPDDIAIVGMACRFAGIATPAQLWQVVMSKGCTLGEHPDPAAAERVDPASALLERLPTVRGGYLRDLHVFEPEALGVSPEVVDGENTDPLFACQLALDALRDAGLTPKTLPTDRVAVALGYAAPLNSGSVNWLQHALVVDQTAGIVQRFFPAATEADLAGIRQQLKAALPALPARTIRSAYPHVVAARVAGMLGAAGAAATIDAGCASALAALRSAMDDLRAQRCDLALAGALQGPLTLPTLTGLSMLLDLTTRDAPVPLCRDADGTLPGEGGGVLVLRRRRDAERLGDRIYAIVRSVGLTARGLPPEHAPHDATGLLSRAIGDALREAGLQPAQIDFVEAHGSGMPREDLAEIQTLREIFGERRGPHPTVGVGSIKSSIGHCLSAAGVAGTIKAALAIYHRVLPPSARCERPHPRLAHPRSPLYLVTEPRPWVRGRTQAPRRAGVNAMDLAGIHGHCILEEHPEDA